MTRVTHVPECMMSHLHLKERKSDKRCATDRIELHHDDKEVLSVRDGCVSVRRAWTLQKNTFLLIPEPTAEQSRVDQTLREQRTIVGRSTRQSHREESAEELGIRWNVCCVIARRHVPVFLILTGTTLQHMRVRGSKDSNTKTEPRN